MTTTTDHIADNTFELAASLNRANAEAHGRGDSRAETERESDEMVAAIERAQARIAEMLRFAGYDVEVKR